MVLFPVAGDGFEAGLTASDAIGLSDGQVKMVLIFSILVKKSSFSGSNNNVTRVRNHGGLSERPFVGGIEISRPIL